MAGNCKSTPYRIAYSPIDYCDGPVRRVDGLAPGAPEVTAIGMIGMGGTAGSGSQAGTNLPPLTLGIRRNRFG